MEKSEKILSRFPGPVRVYPSRLSVIGLLLLSVGGVILLSLFVSGKYGPQPHGAYETIISWFSIVVFAALGIGTLIVLLFPTTICLILDSEGFEIHRFTGSEYVRWRDVYRFDTRTTQLPRSKLERVVFLTSSGSGTLPNNYGLGLQGLLHLMEAWRERAVSQKMARAAASLPR
jgi:hypothetical protein